MARLFQVPWLGVACSPLVLFVLPVPHPKNSSNLFYKENFLKLPNLLFTPPSSSTSSSKKKLHCSKQWVPISTLHQKKSHGRRDNMWLALHSGTLRHFPQPLTAALCQRRSTMRSWCDALNGCQVSARTRETRRVR
jgi:hypothetical protein